MTTIPSPYYGGGQVPNPADVIQTVGSPSTNLINLGLGTLAVDNAAGVIYGLVSKGSGSATWVALGGGSSSGIVTIDGNTGSVKAATVSIVGANAGVPLSFAGSGSMDVLTATITPGAALVATLTGTTGGAVVPTAGNINILGTANEMVFTGAGSTLTCSITSPFTAPGAINATAGAITATNGNLVLGTAGNKLVSTSVATTTTGGANSFGSVALVGGTATVATTAVTANSLIFVTCQALGTVAVASGYAVTAKTAATSFVITASAGTDTSTVAWFIVN